MRTACLINHYNYGQFVEEAVGSALAQTHPLDEIILVDDGSAEEDLNLVRAAAQLSDRVQLIEKRNGGQLSCFSAGIEACSSDIVLFLDADDYWDPQYVERVVQVFQEDPTIDVVGTKERKFFEDGREEIDDRTSRSLGYSRARCMEMQGTWMGSPTSCLAIRRTILEQVFPAPNPKAWRVYADEFLIYGASMAGALMYFLDEPLVSYRIHGQNAFHGNKKSPTADYLSRIEAQRLVEHMREKQSLPRSLAIMAFREFRTIERPTSLEFRDYRCIVRRSNLPLNKKCDLYLRLILHYYFGSRRA